MVLAMDHSHALCFLGRVGVVVDGQVVPARTLGAVVESVVWLFVLGVPMNITTQSFFVRSTDQIEVGAFYQIIGTITNPDAKFRPWLDDRLPLPPQFIQVSGPVVYAENEEPYIPCTLFVDVGEAKEHKPYMIKSALRLHEVNIPEHGVHDHHLVKVPDGLMAALGATRKTNKQNDYGEMVGYRLGRY